jgi:PHD/YefM family antitoxin component YafN of YafNO toxin-antitoxin module
MWILFAELGHSFPSGSAGNPTVCSVRNGAGYEINLMPGRCTAEPGFQGWSESGSSRVQCCWQAVTAAPSAFPATAQKFSCAAKEPVTVLEKGAPVAVVLSPAEFDRLEEQDRIRCEAKARLRKTISLIQREAAERGLTDAEFERLMADET